MGIATELMEEAYELTAELRRSGGGHIAFAPAVAPSWCRGAQ
jgi:hypothetical protein